MLSWRNWPMRGSLTGFETWRLRGRTLEAIALLLAARAAIALTPLERWRKHLGLEGSDSETCPAEARRLARHVERAAGYIPFEAKCLPRAMALSRMLRRRKIPHRLAIAARPASARGGNDDLHARVEVGSTIVIGNLPGPWLVLLNLP